MEIGTTLYLEHLVLDKIKQYQCKVVEKNENYIFIDYPIDRLTKKTTYISKHTSFRVTFIGNDNVVYSFETKILGRAKLTIPVLIISLPDQTELTRIQRREFVRIEEAIDIAVHCPEGSFEPFTTVTVNISGGGLAFYLANEQCIEQQGKPLDIWMAFQMTTGKFHYIYLEAEVVRINYSEHDSLLCSE